MDFGFTDDQREIQRTARDLLADRSGFERVREHAESGRGDDALWRELCELGWAGIAVAEAHGGQGLGLIELSILCEELGASVAAVPFLPTVLASTLIEHAGSQEQAERLLPALAGGETTGAVGVAADGAAELVLGASEAGVIVLVEEERTARVLVPAEATITSTASIDPTRSAALVTAAADAGEELEGDVAAALDRALVAISSELVGVCQRALSMTVDYVKERRQFGVPVGAYQAVSHRCAQMLLETEMARSTTAYAAWSADAEPASLAEAAALAKAAASTAGREVTASAIQAHGGIGFTWEADVHWLYKRAQIDAALLGGAKRQRARLASALSERAAAAQLH
jgi:alkylation response protein AidB-like acyl-CoA dehydrogenase